MRGHFLWRRMLKRRKCFFLLRIFLWRRKCPHLYRGHPAAVKRNSQSQRVLQSRNPSVGNRMFPPLQDAWEEETSIQWASCSGGEPSVIGCSSSFWPTFSALEEEDPLSLGKMYHMTLNWEDLFLIILIYILCFWLAAPPLIRKCPPLYRGNPAYI